VGHCKASEPENIDVIGKEEKEQKGRKGAERVLFSL